MKKVAFITHSFHKKTNSANIYAEEILNKEDFSVEYFYIDDWTVDATGFNEPIIGYDIVIILQLISLEIISKIKCDNIIFMPMYDFSCSWDMFKWLECVNLKILSPTKIIHNRLYKNGFNSYYIKYYPEPLAFMPGDLKKVFLWQRINNINIKTSLQLLNHLPIDQIYLHKAIDPYHTFVEPSEEEITKYNIVFSDWFENKDDYLELIKKVGIYIAPRLEEGGGSAFIDAMKVGKVVIANNNAAMNEYITHNETGLLYDAHNVKPINLDSIDLVQIQKKAYQSVKEGREAWRKSIPDILDFIDSKNSIVIPNQFLNMIRQEKTALKQSLEQIPAKLNQEIAILKQSLEQAETKLNTDKWYHFGKLSRKEKMITLIKMICRKIIYTIGGAYVTMR